MPGLRFHRILSIVLGAYVLCSASWTSGALANADQSLRKVLTYPPVVGEQTLHAYTHAREEVERRWGEAVRTSQGLLCKAPAFVG